MSGEQSSICGALSRFTAWKTIFCSSKIDVRRKGLLIDGPPF